MFINVNVNKVSNQRGRTSTGISLRLQDIYIACVLSKAPMLTGLPKAGFMVTVILATPGVM